MKTEGVRALRHLGEGMRQFLTILLLMCLALPAFAQRAEAPIQQLLQDHGDSIAKPKRKTIQPVIDALVESGLPEVQRVLEAWQAKEIWRNKESGLFVFAEEVDSKTLRIFDFGDGVHRGVQSRPNGRYTFGCFA